MGIRRLVHLYLPYLEYLGLYWNSDIGEFTRWDWRDEDCFVVDSSAIGYGTGGDERGGGRGGAETGCESEKKGRVEGDLGWVDWDCGCGIGEIVWRSCRERGWRVYGGEVSGGLSELAFWSGLFAMSGVLG